jgi:hypothetical protein
MLDREGEPVIDPNTGEKVPGVVSQLEKNKQILNPFVSQEKGGGAGLTPEEQGLSRMDLKEMAEGREKLGLDPVNFTGPTATEGGREIVNPYATPSAMPAENPAIAKSQSQGQQVESGARAAAQHDWAAQYRDWARDPQLRQKILNPVMIDVDDESQFNELSEGDAFVPSGSDKVWIKQGDQAIEVEGTSANAMKSQVMRWEQFPELVKQIMAAKPLHVTENVNNLQEGHVFRHGQGIFIVIDGRPTPVPRTSRIRTPGSKPTNDAPLNR